MQTTLLGLAIAFIIALVAALIGPYFIDWNQFRPQFEAEATQVIGAPVRVAGALDARLLPTPSLRLRSVMVGGANDLGKVRADKLDVEFSLGRLDARRMARQRTHHRRHGARSRPRSARAGSICRRPNGTFNLGSLSIDRLNLTGRVALHDAASRGTLELNDIAFSRRRALAGRIGARRRQFHDFRNALSVPRLVRADPRRQRHPRSSQHRSRRTALSADLEGVLSFESRAPRFDGALVLAAPAAAKAKGNGSRPPPWKISAKVKADPAAARLEQIEASYGAEDTALKATGAADVRFGASPLLRAVLSARQLDADRLIAQRQ